MKVICDYNGVLRNKSASLWNIKTWWKTRTVCTIKLCDPMALFNKQTWNSHVKARRPSILNSTQIFLLNTYQCSPGVQVPFHWDIRCISDLRPLVCKHIFLSFVRSHLSLSQRCCNHMLKVKEAIIFHIFTVWLYLRPEFLMF